MSEAHARLDVWLWRARFFKTRALAAQAVAAGQVRRSRAHASETPIKPAAAVRVGDGLTFWFNGALRTVQIVALGVRRGPAAEAHTLYAETAAQPRLTCAPAAEKTHAEQVNKD